MLGEEDITSWLTPAQAARAAGITVCRIRQIITSGALRYAWTPLGRLVDPQSLRELIDKREQRALSDRSKAVAA